MMNNGGFTDPAHLLGFSFLILSWMILLIYAPKFLRDYVKTKAKEKLLISLLLLSMGLALMFLSLERIFLELLHNEVLGIICAITALIFSASIILLIPLFVILTSYPEHTKKVMVFSTVCVSILISGIIFSIREIQVASNNEIIFPSYLDFLLLAMISPIIILCTMIYSYFAYQLRSISPPHSRRAVYLMLSTYILLGAYIPEVLGFSEIVNYFRVLFVPAIIAFILCFTRFYELEWPKKIRHLYIIHRIQGISLYNHSFVQEQLLDSQLIAGGICGFSDLIREMTKSKKQLKIIDLEDIKVLLEYGEYIISALMTVENFKLLRRKLSSFTHVFEYQFMKDLNDYVGAVDAFQPTKEIVTQFFSYKEN